jgi:protein-tyrosine phosphatase
VFDVHYHLIFGVDDGPQTIEDSLAMAEASIAEGVTHIVATPHANDTYKFDPVVNRERLAMLQERLEGRITLGLGCDFHLSFDNIHDLYARPTRYTINSKQYLLVEFADFGIPQQITEVFRNMMGMGVIPIITHPERNPVLLQEPERLVDWIREGCLLQVTAASLRGRFGPKSEAMAHDLLRKHWVHLIASDAHSVEGRSPSMGRGHEALVEKYGQETADRLCIRNPGAIFDGERLPEQLRPVGIHGDEGHAKKGLLSRVFGK